MDEIRTWLGENYTALYAFALSRLYHPADAEDAVCDTAAEALANADKLRDPDKIAAWVWGILRNVIRRYLRRGARRVENLDDLADAIEDEETLSPIETLVAAEERGRARRILSMLPREIRETVRQRYLEERSHREIAESLSVTMSLVNWRLEEGRRLMRKEYDLMEMENYMKDGYFEPIPLRVDLRARHNGGTEGGTFWENWRALSPKVEAALHPLLASGIAAAAYAKPLTVTEMSRVTGVPAAYIEDQLAKMVDLGVVKQSANRYQTAFPIIDGRTFAGFKKIADSAAEKLFTKIGDSFTKAAEELDFGVPLTVEERAFLLFFGMEQFMSDPLDADDDMAFPLNRGSYEFCIKEYTPDVDTDRVFPIEMYYIDTKDEQTGAQIELHFTADAGQTWFDLQNDREGLSVIAAYPGEQRFSQNALVESCGIADVDGQAKIPVFESYDAYYHAIRSAEEIREKYCRFLGEQRGRLLTDALDLLPERFHSQPVYVACEIRNLIFGSLEQLLLDREIIRPVPWLIVRPPKAEKQEPVGASVVMY